MDIDKAMGNSGLQEHMGVTRDSTGVTKPLAQKHPKTQQKQKQGK
jgi:hypothetical protein